MKMLCFSLFSQWTKCHITNLTSEEPKGSILTSLEKVHYVQNKDHEKQIFSKMLTLPATRCNILCYFGTRLNIFCKQWFSEKMTFFKTSSYENNKIWKYNLNLRQNRLDNNVMILSAKFADIKVSNFLIETRLGAREYSNETIFLTRPSKQCGFCNYLLD